MIAPTIEIIVYLKNNGFTEFKDGSLFQKFYSDEHTVQILGKCVIIDSVQYTVNTLEEFKSLLNAN
jgi:hypothetical protein